MPETDRPRGPHIDWAATLAGAGAAVTVAVLLSTLGAAGTLIGAALGSVTATLSTTLYKHGIESSRRRMADVQAVAMQRVNLAEQNVRRAARRSDPAAAERELDRAHRHLDEAAEVELDETPPVATVADPSRWTGLPWKRIAIAAATVFVLSLIVISAFELIAGKSVSTITGGTHGTDRTSIGGTFGGGGDGSNGQKQSPAPTPTPTPPTPTPDPTVVDTPTPAPGDGTDPASPTPTPVATETTTVTETVTPTPTPTPSAGVTP